MNDDDDSEKNYMMMIITTPLLLFCEKNDSSLSSLRLNGKERLVILLSYFPAGGLAAKGG